MVESGGNVVEDDVKFEKLAAIVAGVQKKREVRKKGSSIKLLRNNQSADYHRRQEPFHAKCREEFCGFRNTVCLGAQFFDPEDPQHQSGKETIYAYKLELCAEAMWSYLFSELEDCISMHGNRLVFPTKNGMDAMFDVCLQLLTRPTLFADSAAVYSDQLRTMGASVRSSSLWTLSRADGSSPRETTTMRKIGLRLPWF